MKKDTMSEYLAAPGVSSSALKIMLESTPRDYLYARLRKLKETPAQTKGTLWHSFMIERDVYEAEHMLQPEDWGPLTQTPGRQKWADFKAEAKKLGKKAIKWSDGQDLVFLASEMQQHRELKKILSDYEAEVSFYAEIDGHAVKSREDIYCAKAKTVWDVKTTSKAMDDESLARVIFDHGYHFSAAHHMRVMQECGHDVEEWGWIFVSTATPCPHIVLKKASKRMLESGRQDWHYAFEKLKMCEEKDCWPGFDEEIREIDFSDNTFLEKKYGL